MHFHLLLSSLFHFPLSCHQTLSLATTPGNPLLPIFRRPFHPLLPHASAQACLGIATVPRMESSLLPVIDNVRGRSPPRVAVGCESSVEHAQTASLRGSNVYAVHTLCSIEGLQQGFAPRGTFGTSFVVLCFDAHELHGWQVRLLP
ncbi:hypothetical protein F5888DRAFT_841360 [Russula emetica]|nr:hypothetical protein F5888DRAFT_841360 [Russula emetica]